MGRTAGKAARPLRVRSFDICFVYDGGAGADLQRLRQHDFRIPKTIAARGFERLIRHREMAASPEFMRKSQKLVVNPYLRIGPHFCNFVSQLMDRRRQPTYPVQRGERVPHEQQQRARSWQE
jgi:hypothetical protein